MKNKKSKVIQTQILYVIKKLKVNFYFHFYTKQETDKLVFEKAINNYSLFYKNRIN